MISNGNTQLNIKRLLKEQERTTQEEYQAQKAEQNSKMICPENFLMLEEDDPSHSIEKEDGEKYSYPLTKGLYLIPAKATEQKGHQDAGKAFFPIRVCKPFKITAEIENDKGVDRSLLLSWRHKGRAQEMEIRQGDIHVNRLKSEMFKTLTDNGLPVPAKKAPKEAFETFILSSGNKHTKTRLKNVGWNRIKGKDYYALPTGEHFPSNTKIYTPKNSTTMAYKQAGTIKAWKKDVARYGDKNRLLALSICLSFAGSLLKLANMEGGGFNLVGSSQTGKSTALKVAASVWGEPSRGRQIQSWRTTDNALENLAQNQNDGVLYLDEMKECNSKALSNASYMLSNGCGKERMKQDSTAQELRSWRLLYISNGETSLKNLIESYGEKSYAGQDVRVTDISADTGKYGIFEDLYHFEDGEKFAAALSNAFSENYGTAGREWLKCLTEQDSKAIKAEIQKEIREFVKESSPEGFSIGQITSILKRFALCAVAGELAIKWNILPWEAGTAQRLMKENITYWLKERGTSSGEETRILDDLRRALEIDESRFQTDINKVPTGCLGWKTGDIFYLHTTGFKEVFKGYDLKLVKRTLVKKNIIEREQATPQRYHNKTQRAFPINSALLL